MEAPTQARQWVLIASSDAIPEGQARTFDAEGVLVALARVQGQLFAVQDRCSHDDGPLGAGCLSGYGIQCPRHGARFDVRTGEVLSMPAIVPIGTFAVRETDGRVEVQLPTNVITAEDDDDW